MAPLTGVREPAKLPAMTPKSDTPANKLVSGKVAASPPKRIGVNISLPPDLHRRLRIRALENDVTMAEAIELAIAAWLDR